jgi:hypothetical protein
MIVRSAGAAAILLAATIAHAAADQLAFPSTVLPREAAAQIVYRLDAPVRGAGLLHIDWSDDDGHVLDRRDIRVKLAGQSEIPFTLDTRRALAVGNRLAVRLAARGRTKTADARFVVSPPAPDWSDYQIIMWQPQSVQNDRLLKSIGVDAAMMIADRAAPRHLDPALLRPLVGASLRWYVENIATDFYSAYHRWSPGKPVNWRFLAVQQLYRANPDDRTALIRDPSLSDAAWRNKIALRVGAVVAADKPYRPLFYNLADEAGIADLNAFWDFDFSRPSLAAMRQWLKTRYSNLAALNAEWGTRFASWGAVMPMTTAAAMKRGNGNYAAWEDFRAFMDVAFARAVAAGTAAIHAADPTALSGLTGAQKPGWGGYDYATLAGTTDVMEPESGLFPLIRDLAPRVRLLSTSFGGGPEEEHGIWQALLDGGNGIIIWDSKRDFIAADGTFGPRGRYAASYFPELRTGLGALVLNLRRLADPVAILYSPASLETQWLLDWRGKGDAWTERGADAEDRDDGTVRAAMNAYDESLTRLGFVPRYLSPDMIERGALAQGCRVLILPHAIALSRAEARAIRNFAARGGTVIADVAPGTYDEHGRRLDHPRAVPVVTSAPGDAARLGVLLAGAGMKPSFPVSGAGAVRRVFEDGKVELLAVQKDGAMPAGGVVTVSLPRPAFVYDLRAKSFLGRQRSLTLTLDDAAPTLLALAPTPLPAPELSAPQAAHPGEWVRLRFGFSGASPTALHVLHLALRDPAGRPVAAYATNVVTRQASVQRDIFLAENAPLGRWRVDVSDVLSGQTVTQELTVATR